MFNMYKIIKRKRISNHKITVYKNAKEGFIYLVVKITPVIKFLYLFQWLPLPLPKHLP